MPPPLAACGAFLFALSAAICPLCPPVLNDEFIESNTPIDRNLAVLGSYLHLLCDFYFDYKHVRALTTYGVPASLGRF